MEISLAKIHEELGITSTHLAQTKLNPCEEAPIEELQVVELDLEGKPFVLLSSAALAWKQMRSAASGDGVVLLPFSGFRSYLYQKRIIAQHLTSGRPLDHILKSIAIPGFSEHHTGRAVDIVTDNMECLEEEFEKTDAFAWLSENAARFHFSLSYPRENKVGIVYEPWHWYYSP